MWALAGLPTHSLVHQDFVATLTRLLIATGSTDRTTHIVSEVIKQAIQLERSSEWVQTELTFEAFAEVVGDQQMALAIDSQSQGAGSEAPLDLSNDRFNRLNP